MNKHIGIMTDRLVEISRDDWPRLKELYTPDGSKSYLAYTTIDSCIRCLDQDPNYEHFKVYCLNGDFSDGTFVATDRNSAFADTFNESHDNLKRLLQLLDYSKGYFFMTLRTPIRPVVLEALEKASVKVIYDDSFLLYYLSKEDALELDTLPPKGIHLRPLTERYDIEKANSAWTYHIPNPLPFFNRMVKFNTNIAAFKDEETLVAWSLRYPTGTLAALQTDENYLCQGYGSLVTRCISKRIAEMGHDIYAGISEQNTISRALYGKIGFKVVGQIHWIITPNTGSSVDE